jgi:hypothetical protein
MGIKTVAVYSMADSNAVSTSYVCWFKYIYIREEN